MLKQKLIWFRRSSTRLLKIAKEFRTGIKTRWISLIRRFQPELPEFKRISACLSTCKSTMLGNRSATFRCPKCCSQDRQLFQILLCQYKLPKPKKDNWQWNWKHSLILEKRGKSLQKCSTKQIRCQKVQKYFHSNFHEANSWNDEK